MEQNKADEKDDCDFQAKDIEEELPMIGHSYAVEDPRTVATRRRQHDTGGGQGQGHSTGHAGQRIDHSADSACSVRVCATCTQRRSWTRRTSIGSADSRSPPSVR